MEDVIRKTQVIAEKVATTSRSRRSRIHDMRRCRTTLKQWRILHAVVDCGGFSGAAEFLNTSQSTVSYAVSKLQQQIGIRLLVVEGRKARVTEEGRAILERSRHLIKNALEIELFAEHVHKGLKANLRMVVARNFPTDIVMPVIRHFSVFRRDVKVLLSEVSVDQIEHMLNSQSADLAVTCRSPYGFSRELLTELEYIPVAHPDHELCRRLTPVTANDLERAVQIHVSDPMDPISDISFLMNRADVWLVSNYETAENALRQGLGYGWLPRHRVQRALETGELKKVPIMHEESYRQPFFLVYGQGGRRSSAVTGLAQALLDMPGLRQPL